MIRSTIILALLISCSFPVKAQNCRVVESVSMTTDGDTILHAWEKFDENGQIVEHLIRGYGNTPDEKTTYTYEGENIRRKKVMEWDGGEWEMIGKTKYLYDGEDKLIEKKTLWRGEKGIVEYVYSEGLVSKELQYDEDGLEFTYEHFYDHKGNRIRTECIPHISAQIYIKRIERKYDGKGRLIRTTTFDSNGSSSVLKYSYGFFSGRLKKKVFDNGSSQRQVIHFRSFKGLNLAALMKENGRALFRSHRRGDQFIREELGDEGQVTKRTYIFCSK